MRGRERPPSTLSFLTLASTLLTVTDERSRLTFALFAGVFLLQIKVRIMENPEEILQHLEEFTRLRPNDIPRELEEYLKLVAKTGDPVYQWPTIKYLLLRKLNDVVTQFWKSCPPEDVPPCPNVEVFNYGQMFNNILYRFNTFAAAPFTLQRICELLTNPRKEYTRIDKYMRALEKNILVVSTMEPSGRRIENGDSIMSGIESDGDYVHVPEAAAVVNVHVPEAAAVVNVQEDSMTFASQSSSEEFADTKQAVNENVINGVEDGEPALEPQYLNVSEDSAFLPSDCAEPSYFGDDEGKNPTEQNDKMIIEIPSSTNQMLVYVPYDAFKSGQVSIEPVSEGSGQTSTEQEKPVDETITITAVNIEERSSSSDGKDEQSTEKPTTTPESLSTDNLLESTDLLLEKIKNKTAADTESDTGTTPLVTANIPVNKKEDSDVKTSYTFSTATDSSPATTSATLLQTTELGKTTAEPKVVTATAAGGAKDQEDVDVISESSSTSSSQDSPTIVNKEDNNISPENSISSSDSSGDSHCQSSTDSTSIAVKDSAIPQEDKSEETVATTEEASNVVDSTTSSASEDSESTTAEVSKEQPQSVETTMEVDVSEEQASKKHQETPMEVEVSEEQASEKKQKETLKDSS